MLSLELQENINFSFFRCDTPLHSWEQAGYDIRLLRWESPGKFNPGGRTQPEVKKYLRLLLLGGQPGPSPLSLAKRDCKKKWVYYSSQGKGSAGRAIRGCSILIVRLLEGDKRDLERFLYLVVLGGSVTAQELHIAPCVILFLLAFVKHAGKGKGLRRRGQRGFAGQQDGTSSPPCKISSPRLGRRWKFLEFLLRENAGPCFSGLATLPMPQLLIFLPLSKNKMA